jgi:hypothetical protein
MACRGHFAGQPAQSPENEKQSDDTQHEVPRYRRLEKSARMAQKVQRDRRMPSILCNPWARGPEVVGIHAAKGWQIGIYLDMWLFCEADLLWRFDNAVVSPTFPFCHEKTSKKRKAYLFSRLKHGVSRGKKGRGEKGKSILFFVCLSKNHSLILLIFPLSLFSFLH